MSGITFSAGKKDLQTRARNERIKCKKWSNSVGKVQQTECKREKSGHNGVKGRQLLIMFN